MQVAAILMTMPVMPVEQPMATPVDDGEWAALMADFGEAAVVTEDAVAETEVEVDLPDVPLPALPPLPLSMLPEPLPKGAVAPVAPQQDGTMPVQKVPVQPEILPDNVVESVLPTAPTPDAAVDAVPDIPKATVKAPPPPPMSPRRSKAENLWEMQGLMAVPTAQPDPEIPAQAIQPITPRDPSIPPKDIVQVAPDQPDAALVLPFNDPIIALDLPEVVPIFSAAIHHNPVPLLHNSPPSQPETLSPTFVTVVQTQAVKPDEGGVSVTLDPLELGKLHLAMVQDGDQLRVAITAERPETLELLRRHSDQLAQELRQAGFQSASFSFAQGGQGDKPPPPPVIFADEPGIEPVIQPPAPDTPRRSRTATGGLDLRI